MAISQTVLKHRTTMKHPNKEEPEALGKAEVVKSQQLEPQHDQTLIEKKDEREKREEWDKIEKDRRKQEKERGLKENE